MGNSMQKSRFQNYSEYIYTSYKETFTIIKGTLFFHLFVKEQLIHLKKGTIPIPLFLISGVWLPGGPRDTLQK
jgi:hypothetical protein